MNNDFSFNPETDFVQDTIIPEGQYQAMVTAYEWKTSKAGKDYCKLTFEIIEGDCQSRCLWENLNFFHDSESARQMAKRTMGKIMLALGISAPLSGRDSIDSICNQRLTITVKHKADADGEMRAQISGYSAKAKPAAPNMDWMHKK